MEPDHRTRKNHTAGSRRTTEAATVSRLAASGIAPWSRARTGCLVSVGRSYFRRGRVNDASERRPFVPPEPAHCNWTAASRTPMARNDVCHPLARRAVPRRSRSRSARASNTCTASMGVEADRRRRSGLHHARGSRWRGRGGFRAMKRWFLPVPDPKFAPDDNQGCPCSRRRSSSEAAGSRWRGNALSLRSG